MESAQNIQQDIAGARNFVYIECSLPAGLTIAEYRRLRPRRPSLWKRLKG